MTMTTHTLRAEWMKLRTLRSTSATAAGSVALSVLIAVVGAATQTGSWDEMSAAQRADIDPTATALVGVLFTTVIFGAWAARSVTSEHSTGMIRTTFAALPNRRAVVLAKATIVGGVAVAAALVGNVVAFFAGQRVLAGVDADVALGEPGAARSVVLGALAVGAVAIIGIGIGGITRRTAAATTLVAVTIIGSQMIAVVFPEGLRRYLPGHALQATVTGRPSSDLLDPLPALMSLGAYGAIALTIATFLVARRDV
jgi:hypothetical protein